MTDQLKLVALHRLGSYKPKKRERHSFDFVVNGVSLFKATRAADYDMCGALSDPQLERDLAQRINREAAAKLTSEVPASGHRASLFVCSECGDFACGAITAHISRTRNGVQWSDFAYENGFEPARKFALGPFEFAWDAYCGEISQSEAD